MATESKTAVYVGLAANVLIAATKFAAAYLTGSSAMATEGVHSLVDTSNEVMLLLGQSRAARPADEAHPLGHGKELYFWTLIVAILFFALGAGMSFYEGVRHVLHPEPIHDAKWSYIVLGASALFTLGSFVFSFRAFARRAGTLGYGYWTAFRRSKDPTLITLVFEDLADLAGVLLAFLGVYFGRRLHNPYLDGSASIGIGVVMTVVAMLLARESMGLLIGESATEQQRAVIRTAALRESGVSDIRRMTTLYFGPDTMLLLLDVRFRDELDAAGIGASVDRMESRIREALPEVKHIYIEADSLADTTASRRASGEPA